MRRLLVALCLFSSLTAHAGGWPAQFLPGASGGGPVIKDMGSLIILWANLTQAGAVKYSSFRKAGTSAGYAVTAGKTLTIWGCRAYVLTAAASNAFALGYATADAGLSASSATGFTSAFGATTPDFFTTATASTSGYIDAPIVTTVPAGDFLTVTCTGSITENADFECFGTEQ